MEMNMKKFGISAILLTVITLPLAARADIKITDVINYKGDPCICLKKYDKTW
jgi:hypothetical protein